MKGFAVDVRSFYALSPEENQKMLAKIREWGFDTILICDYWAQLQNEDHTLNTPRIAAIQKAITWAKGQNLTVILSVRVQVSVPPASYEHNNWINPPTAQWVNNTSEGLAAFTSFIELFVQTFPDVIYCLWHFPYHKIMPTAEERTRFYTITFPALLYAVRKHSNNPVVFTPIHQGLLDLASDQSDTSYYVTATPQPDNNIIYAVGHMIPWAVLGGQEWNYNTAAMDSAFAGIKRWRENFNLPMLSVEYAPFHQPITQHSRLDCLSEAMKRMLHYDVGFAYWRLTIYQQEVTNILTDIPTLTPNQDILTRLQATIPPNTFTLTIIATVGGTTDPPPGGGIYLSGSIATVYANPQPNYIFENWWLIDMSTGVGSTVNGNPLQITMDRDYMLTPIFKQAPQPPEGCFIATACGTSNPSLEVLRSFRDTSLPNTLVKAYYHVSPTFAKHISKHESVKRTLRRVWEWLACQVKKNLML